MRILVVEDDKALAKNIKKGLSLKGYAVDSVFDGSNALRRIQFHHMDYDVIVLDVMLPGKDGITVCKETREQKIKTPIIMLTARGALDDKLSAFEIGADDYITKPFSFEELSARINALTRRPKETQYVELSAGDLILHTGSRTVERKNKEIILTLKEYALLEYLLQNKNNVINREQLQAHVWDFADDSFSNVIDVHIKNIRKKIDMGHRTKLIQTIRGIGYKIHDPNEK